MRTGSPAAIVKLARQHSSENASAASIVVRRSGAEIFGRPIARLLRQQRAVEHDLPEALGGPLAQAGLFEFRERRGIGPGAFAECELDARAGL